MMIAAQDQDGRQLAGQGRPSLARAVGGFALMFAGVALMSYGAHFLFRTGTCSSTGYVEYGPVPKCSAGEPLYIMSAFFVGPLFAIVGWLLARAWGWLWPAFCLGMSAALITIHYETGPSLGAREFALLSGMCMVALAGLSVIRRVRKRHRPPEVRSAAGPGTTVVATTLAPAPIDSAWAPAVTGDGSDPIDKIVRLAQLRDTGALTWAEFESQKERLLAEI